MTNYKSGTVARLRVHGKEATAVRYKDGWAYVPDESDSIAGTVGYCDDTYGKFTDIRPLVVLDLDSHKSSRHYNLPAHLRGLVEADPRPSFNGGPQRDFALWIADQIEEQTKPPKPAEPKGWGAVIEDSRGRYWTLINPAEGIWSESNGNRNQYDRLTPVRVVREGVDV